MELDLQRELAVKQEKDKQLAKEEEIKRKQREIAAKDARRRELIQANAVLNRDGPRTAAPAHAENTVYDPFAEDEKRVMPVAMFATITKTLKPKSGAAAVRAGPSKAGPSKSSTVKQKDSPPPLGRKEKAAQAFAQEARSRTGDSMVSIRDLVQARHASPRQRSSPKSNTQSAIMQTIPPFPSLRKPSQSASISKVTGKRGRHTDELQALCPDRTTRDRRTIDEIQRDIKARKAGTEGGGAEPRREKRASRSRSPLKGFPSKVSPVASTARPVQSRSIPPPPQYSKAPTTQRARSYSSASTTSSPTPPPSHKRRRSRSPPFPGAPGRSDISAQIQALFHRPGRAPFRPAALSDDGSSDMEAGMSDVEQEERRTAAIARKEDQAAEREEMERKDRKDRIRKQRMTGR